MPPSANTPPPSPSIHQETLQFLYQLRRFGAKPGLDLTRHLAQFAGNPQHGLTFIHVAGTNGKGSTCAMLENIYRQTGLRVGLYTSPHLSLFGERIQVNRQLISPESTTRLVNELKPFNEQSPPDAQPSFFELVTVLALRHFQEQQCDLVIWETGLGGRLDSTNIVSPAATIITQIGFDHQQWLGHTLPQIAREKAGIIKPGVPVITAVSQPDALEVITQTAQALSAPLHHVGPADLLAPPLDTLTLPLPGHHQRTNAALAARTVQILSSRFPVTPAQLRTGLESVRWAGRCEVVKTPHQGTLLLDGAHNPSAATALAETVQARFPSRLPTLILGLFQDKEITEVCRILAPLSMNILTVPIDSNRTAHPSELAGCCTAANPAARVRACDSLQQALTLSRTDNLILITGSLHLVGQARDLLGLTPNGDHHERQLNEWIP